MIASIIIGIAIFGYAGWTTYQHIQKSKEGKCAACELKSNCNCNCQIDDIYSKSHH